MSYDPTNWKSGDVVTSAKLNKMEKGIEDANAGGGGGGVLVVTDTDGTLNKTWQEIHDAGFAVLNYTVNQNSFFTPMFKLASAGYLYSVFFSESDPVEYVATSADGYPEMSQ